MFHNIAFSSFLLCLTDHCRQAAETGPQQAAVGDRWQGGGQCTIRRSSRYSEFAHRHAHLRTIGVSLWNA
eukprot:19408-Eustigmatos_ZCMA.PRE.1